MAWVNKIKKIDKRLMSHYASSDKTSKVIRQKFLDYFINTHSHNFVRSSPVVPFCDPSVAFVNAGMNQFKGIFLGAQEPHYEKVANSQKCVRVGGKHNDLDTVGSDGYHHTFFEMLGNWSFGNYFKKEACTMAWDLLTKEYQINPNRLYVTYFKGDSKLGIEADIETKEIWKSLGIPEDRILPFSSKENFWEMGDIGPCGPCTEIHIDHLSNLNRAQFINKGLHDLTELWNIVFIQYNRKDDNQIELLPKKHIDTGMGFERLVAVLQGKISNYDTDNFSYLMKAIHKNCGNIGSYSGKFGENDWNSLDTSYRTLADHARMITVCLADGIIPEQNQKLRRVMRKAFGLCETVFNRDKGLLKELSNYIIEHLGHAYPELERNVKQIHQIMDYEESIYESIRNEAAEEWKKIINNNVKLSSIDVVETPGIVAAYKELIKVNPKSIDGELGFKLYDTHGLDKEIIKKLGDCLELPFDTKQFDKELDAARDRLKRQFTVKSNTVIRKLLKNKVPKTNTSAVYSYTKNDNRYSFENLPIKILKIVSKDQLLLNIHGGVTCTLILDKTNMYSEAGGQMSDYGIIKVNGYNFEVKNVQNIDGYIFHEGILNAPTNFKLKCGDEGTIEIDTDRRLNQMRNHTATHLLNAALKDMKGATCQKSSRVTNDYLNLDVGIFNDKMTTQEIDMVEKKIQELINNKLPVAISEVDNQKLYGMDYVTLIPGEIYPDIGIRIVEIKGHDGFISREPCCGTHVTNTADIEDFCITEVKSLGRSTATIYAVTGERATKAKIQSEDIAQKLVLLEKSLDKSRNETEKLMEMVNTFRSQFLTTSDEISPIPYVAKCEYLNRLSKLNVELKASTKDKAKEIIEKEMQKALKSKLLQTKNKRQHYVVHSILHPATDISIPLQKATKLCNNLPVIVIACADNIVKARCCVPPHLANALSAQKWLEETVGSTLNASVAPPKGQDANYVANMKSKKVNGNVEVIVKKCEEAARRYIEDHL